MVGEIRDQETANTAIEAALTGHLVLSTLHTNDASSTPTRLVEMGVEPFLVASALDCVVAQRLPRKLCDRCREAYTPTEAELTPRRGRTTRRVAIRPGLPRGQMRPVRPEGLPRPVRKVHEVLTISEEIEKMIIEHAHTADIQKVAVAQGMIKMKQAGLIQVQNGITTFEEIASCHRMTVALTRSLRSLRSGELDRACDRPAEPDRPPALHFLLSLRRYTPESPGGLDGPIE